MKTKNKKKQGISLIVLVITIIVMIILAAAVILSLSSSGIIDRANEAVTETNLKQVETLAQTIWSEIYIENLEGANLDYETEVPKRLEEQGIDTTKYIIDANDSGVTVKAKSNDKTAPVLTITTPESSDEANPTQVVSSSFTVTGKVEDESAIKSLTVNGTETTVNEDGSWSYTLTLNANETTTITVVAIDENQNTTTVLRYVYYKKLEPGLYQTRTNYGTLLKSWDTLISEGIITEDGKVVPGKEAFLYGDLMISDSLSEIVAYSYTNTQLTGATIPDSVTRIGDYAFNRCQDLANIFIPDSVTTIGINSLGECVNLKNVILENDGQLINIGDYAFYLCSGLTSINLSDVTFLGLHAFHCSGLTSVVIPDSVPAIGAYTFASSGLQSATISASAIGLNAFYACGDLEQVTLTDSVTSIGTSAFESCTALKSIVIPASVPVINSNAFKGCALLETATISNGTQLGYQIFTGTQLKNILFNGTVAEWNALGKNAEWNKSCGAITVTCTDGTVTVPAYSA